MKPRKIPMRMCVGCRQMKPKRELLRVVKSPEGVVSLDLTGRKPGRGAYVCASEACFLRAVKQKQLERAFSSPVDASVRDGIAGQIKALAAQQAAQAASSPPKADAHDG